jgi:hypothetical protein
VIGVRQNLPFSGKFAALSPLPIFLLTNGRSGWKQKSWTGVEAYIYRCGWASFASSSSSLTSICKASTIYGSGILQHSSWYTATVSLLGSLSVTATHLSAGFENESLLVYHNSISHYGYTRLQDGPGSTLLSHLPPSLPQSLRLPKNLRSAAWKTPSQSHSVTKT